MYVYMYKQDTQIMEQLMKILQNKTSSNVHKQSATQVNNTCHKIQKTTHASLTHKNKKSDGFFAHQRSHGWQISQINKRITLYCKHSMQANPMLHAKFSNCQFKSGSTQKNFVGCSHFEIVEQESRILKSRYNFWADTMIVTYSINCIVKQIQQFSELYQYHISQIPNFYKNVYKKDTNNLQYSFHGNLHFPHQTHFKCFRNTI
eukprot:TRINITY_DN6343_c0_g1_i8.p3 TRINITY_DN6343_c0_g1~~TRINITY_DN6343_c0_g1_i8.p3  ORF type:complete len:204 (-),score=-9.89 TRINITY_DN6343_c0_g1_i8:115-726(-)